MLSEAAAKIDRGLGNEVAEDFSETAQNPLADFQPVMRRTRKPGTGCITQINDHLFEGRYSPTWPDGTKHSKCVYAHTATVWLKTQELLRFLEENGTQITLFEA
ncbi:hypothetical protein [Pseudoflavonifractor phocaeensis]|uniref:hypothetical protein n=1 Tax=Pseudoflavonifractor phocaeensis TaxID=1870988 RepID=UPI001FAEB245|nr:hypothetical protein [Pseudoflavonifractor phocaeensis]